MTASVPRLIDYRIDLLLDFSFADHFVDDSGLEKVADRLTGLTLGQLGPGDWLHDARLAPAAARPIADSPLWECRKWEVSDDFPPISSRSSTLAAARGEE